MFAATLAICNMFQREVKEFDGKVFLCSAQDKGSCKRSSTKKIWKDTVKKKNGSQVWKQGLK